MASQEWNDHDRSQKLLAPDLAKNYLMGCPKNAILFTYGDNDTYPLWYAQEVEGVRPDVRIINTSLLGIDWYVNQLRYKINESPAIDVLWSEDQVRGLAYVTVDENQPKEQDDLLSMMKSMGKQAKITTFPAVKTVTLPVDINAAIANGIISAKDSATQQITFALPAGKSYYTLDQLAMLNVIAANAWKRPICFTSPEGGLGFRQYLRQRGLIFELSPLQDNAQFTGLSMATDTSYNLLMNHFRSGNAQNGNVYFDEENRRHLLTIRQAYAFTASTLAAEGRKQEAKNLLDKAESLINTEAMPYAMAGRGHNQTTMFYLRAAYDAGHTELAKKVKTALVKDLNEQQKYYNYLKEFKEDFYFQLSADEKEAQDFLKEISQWEMQFEGKQPPKAELPLPPNPVIDSNSKP